MIGAAGLYYWYWRNSTQPASIEPDIEENVVDPIEPEQLPPIPEQETLKQEWEYATLGVDKTLSPDALQQKVQKLLDAASSPAEKLEVALKLLPIDSIVLHPSVRKDLILTAFKTLYSIPKEDDTFKSGSIEELRTSIQSVLEQRKKTQTDSNLLNDLKLARQFASYDLGSSIIMLEYINHRLKRSEPTPAVVLAMVGEYARLTTFAAITQEEETLVAQSGQLQSNLYRFLPLRGGSDLDTRLNIGRACALLRRYDKFQTWWTADQLRDARGGCRETPPRFIDLAKLIVSDEFLNLPLSTNKAEQEQDKPLTKQEFIGIITKWCDTTLANPTLTRKQVHSLIAQLLCLLQLAMAMPNMTEISTAISTHLVNALRHKQYSPTADALHSWYTIASSLFELTPTDSGLQKVIKCLQNGLESVCSEGTPRPPLMLDIMKQANQVGDYALAKRVHDRYIRARRNQRNTLDPEQ